MENPWVHLVRKLVKHVQKSDTTQIHELLLPPQRIFPVFENCKNKKNKNTQRVAQNVCVCVCVFVVCVRVRVCACVCVCVCVDTTVFNLLLKFICLKTCEFAAPTFRGSTFWWFD